MPRAYPHRPHLKLAILERIHKGETLNEVCASEGMPGMRCVLLWARKDPEFAAALKRERARTAEIRRFRVDPVRAREFLRRQACGARVSAVVRHPDMPSLTVYRRWRHLDGAFSERVHLNRMGKYGRGVAHKRWREFDQDVADRIIVAVSKGAVMRRLLATDRAFPSLAVLERWRRENPEFDGALKTAMKVGSFRRPRDHARQGWAPMEEILERIRGGASLRQLAAQPDMPSGGTLYAWVKKRPEFARAVEEACRDRNQILELMAWTEAQRTPPGPARQMQARVAPYERRLARLTRLPGGGRWKG